MRDAIIAVELSRDAGVDVKNSTVATVINTSNGAYIDVSEMDVARLLIHVKNTAGSEYDVTVQAGIYSRAGLGDLVVPVSDSTGEKGICIESSRFKQADGKIYIDFETSMTGTIAAYYLP